MEICNLEAALISAIVVACLSVVFVYILNAGMFRGSPKVVTRTPPIRGLSIMYKFGTGAYKNVGPVFGEANTLAPNNDLIGLYYDDPDVVPADSLRWAVGVILAEGIEEVDLDLQGSLQAAGFKHHMLPCADLAVQVEWEMSNKLALLFLIRRVYPAICTYLKEKDLMKANPCVEVYHGKNATVMFPLDHQDGFYIPDVKEKKE